MEVLQRSFNGGILTPEFFAKSDDAKYFSGLESCDNFIVLPHGPVINRGGTKFVSQARYSDRAVRLIPFKYSINQQFVIELGDHYARFHTLGQTLLHGAAPTWNGIDTYNLGDLVDWAGIVYQARQTSTNKPPATEPDYWYQMPSSAYEIYSPYSELDLFDLTFVQSKDVMTFCHSSYQPYTLSRYDVVDWRFETVNFEPTIQPPTIGVSAYLFGVNTGKPYTYVVTAFDGVSESRPSIEVSTVNNLNSFGAKNTVSWPAVPNAKLYFVYLKVSGVYAYLGQTSDLSFVDENISPDPSRNPPSYDAPFGENGIKSVQIANGGINYGTIPTGGGTITSVRVDVPGNGYDDGDTLTASDPTGSGAEFLINLAGGGSIGSVAVIGGGGAGYTQVTFSLMSTTGAGARLAAIVSPRVFTTPVAVVNDPTGTGAVLQLIYNSSGTITQAYVAQAGKNYSNPTISIPITGGGSGATFGTIELTGASYPSCVTYYEQRKCFAGTDTEPLAVWMTKTGTESNISYSAAAVLDTDRINFRIASAESAKIRHLVPLGYLIALTDSSEYRISSINSDALTQTSFNVRPYSYYGASRVQPVLTGNTAIFNGNRDNKLYQIAYNSNGQLAIDDLSMRAGHLFRGYTTKDLSVSYSPHRAVYATRDDGKIICFTYIPEQDVGAFYTFSFGQGLAESATVIRDGDDDRLYILVSRVVNGNTVKYIEALDSTYETKYLDSYLSRTGAPTTSLSGLTHLAGEQIKVIADGYVYTKTVSPSGQITLDTPASEIHCGLGYVSEFKTLPVAYNSRTDSVFGVNKIKSVSHVYLRVLESNNIEVSANNGRDFFEGKERTFEGYDEFTNPQSGVIEIAVNSEIGYDGSVVVRQQNQKKANILFIVTKFA